VPYLVYEPRPTSLLHLLDESLRWSDRDAFVHAGQRIAYEHLHRLAERGAAELIAGGVAPHDRVLLLGANTIGWIVSFWATLRAGATVVLGNGWWSRAEVDHAIALTAPTVVIADDRCRPLVHTELPLLACESLGRDATVHAPARQIDTDEDDAAVIQFTSGSTGSPKGAVLSHRALIANQHMLLLVARKLPGQSQTDGEREVSLQTGPLFHVGGVQAFMRSMLTGGTMVFLRRKFDPTEVLNIVESERVTRWGGSPTMISRVLSHPDIDRWDVTSLTNVTLGGAPSTAELSAAIRARFPSASRGVSQIYGMSEAGGTLCAASGRASAERPGVTGRPLPLVELRIDDAGADGAGEVLVRSPTAMNGYWGEERDDTVELADGWLRTGDLGRLDADGYLYVTGRSKDVIIRGGENIAAVHVEVALGSHPDVLEVAVVGLPDHDLGEIVGAAVRLRQGATPSVENLRAHVAERLAYFEVPERWQLSDQALPVNATGKLDKRAIRTAWPA
jgi:long-chain acyl-CoA synthetase